MSENFSNEFSTTLNGAITDSATSLVVTSATGAPAANFRIRIDDEYMLVTAVASTTLTVTRGLEGSTAASHSDLATVNHVLTAAGLRQGLTDAAGLLASSKATADTPDDDFLSTSLDGKWTAVAGSSGTVSLLESGDVAKYDLATRPGSMLIQVGSAATQQVLLRQDYTLPDGASIVAAISPAIHFGAMAGDELQIGLSLNTDDSGYGAGTSYLHFHAVEVDSLPDTQTVVLGSSGGAATITLASTQRTPAYGETIFLRISRSGLFYYPMISYDGQTWAQFGGTSYAAAFTNIWLFARNGGTTGTPVPIQSVRWIRQGTNGVDPW